MELRDYQKKITKKGLEILKTHKFLYLAIQQPQS